jgi:hypothetical protein
MPFPIRHDYLRLLPLTLLPLLDKHQTPTTKISTIKPDQTYQTDAEFTA